MIRRLLVATAVVVGSIAVVGGTASASGGYVVCAYNVDPLNVGVCVGI